MHPLEQLRYLARRWGSGEEFPVQEVAAILAELAEESPATLLHACRRLIEYFPAVGVAWWLSARVLSAAGALEAIWEAAEELADDPTVRSLGEALAAEGARSVAVAGGTPRLLATLRSRGMDLQKRPARADVLVVVAGAAGPDAVLVSTRAAAAAGASAGTSGPALWAVVDRGSLLPGALWEQLLDRAAPLGGSGTLPVEAFTLAVRDRGTAPPAVALARPTCAAVSELLGWRS